MRRRHSLAPRDQAASPFSGILMRLCAGSSAIAAAFVDAEGETVDYAGELGPFEIKVAAAEWRLVLRRLHESKIPAWRTTAELVVRASARSYAVHSMSEGYALVLCLPRRCLSVSRRAIAEALRELCAESGLEPWGGAPSSLERWVRVDVRTASSDRRRPASLWHQGAWAALELLGRYRHASLAHDELGFRVRTASGAEFNLVREPLDRWYADDLPT
ncbi:MAG: hypothetical protein OZ921_12515 [Sorangiineae bacterium]|nr:hypothetical protein [Polyangiaceae bacterium]MEB2323330.1 hypothetical protein [Sorangiineae bacterium]